MRRPGRLDEGATQPVTTVTGAGRATLARRLVAGRSQPGPGAELVGGGEPLHVGSGLGHDHLGGLARDPGIEVRIVTTASKGPRRAVTSSVIAAIEASRKSTWSMICRHTTAWWGPK